MEQDDHQCSIPNEAAIPQSAAETYDSVITDLLSDQPVLDKIIDDNILAEAICATVSDEFVQNVVNIVDQSSPVLQCGDSNERDDCDFLQSNVLAIETTSESENVRGNETSKETDEEDATESSEEPVVKKRRRIVTPTNDDDDDSDGVIDEEQQSYLDMPIVVESSELNEEHETPKPKCKKASTIMLKEIQARVLLESAVMISADTTCRKKKNRILDSDEDENGENISGSTDNGVINDISDIGLDSNDPAVDDLNSIDVHCNEIRDDEIQEVYISHQENNLDIGTEIETCKLDFEQDGSGVDSDEDKSKHSNSVDSEDEEAPDPMAGIFETDPSDSSQGEGIFGHDPHSENEFMTASDVEKSRRLDGYENDDSSGSETNAHGNVQLQSGGDSEVEEGEIRLNQARLKLPSTTTSDTESVKAAPQSSNEKPEKGELVTDELKQVDLPSIKIIDVKTINEIVNSVDSSLISNDNNIENNDINSDNHSNANNNLGSKGSSSKARRSKNKSNRDPFDYSTSSSSDDFIPNEIYFGSPDLLARHQRRRARRKESRRNNHKNKRRTNFYDATSSSPSDTDSMDGRYSKKYFPHNNRSKANAKNKKRKKRKNDRFYDRSRDIPPEVYFGDVQVPLHVLHSYGATSNSNPGSSDSDSSAYRRNSKNTNRGGRPHNSNTNNNNNRRAATAPSRSRRYSSSSSISTVNSIVSPSRDNLIETMKRYLKAAGIMRQIKLNRLWEGCKSNKERADKILEVLREKGLEGEPTMAKCKELKIRLQTKKELEELNPNVIIVTEGNAYMRRARRSTTRAATEKSLQTNPLEFTIAPEVAPPIPTDAAETANPIECSSTLNKLKNVIDPDSD